MFFLPPNTRTGRLSSVAISAMIAGLIVVPATAHAAPTTPPTPSQQKLGDQGAILSPDTALGSGWRKSSDTLVTGAGDSAGFHPYVAREKNAFTWSTLATLKASSLDMGTWTGEVCVTGSGRYAVAVYAPSVAANKPNLLMAGALAAVVDVQAGAATTVATGIQLAYFNPGCGPDDRVLLTRSLGREGEQTDLLAIDASTATLTQTQTDRGPVHESDPGSRR